jgi:hypothetical protein
VKKGRAAIAKKAERLETLKIQYEPLGSLQPNSYNPNRQSDYDFALLCRSIIEDGYTQPIVALRSSNVIVDGEHRWTAMIVVQSLALEYDLVKVGKGEQTIPEKEYSERRYKRGEWLPKVADAEIAVVKVDMTEEQAKIATLRHNRARGEEDIELTAQVLRDLQVLGALDWAQESLQMSDDEINRMIEDVEVPEYLGGDEFTEAWEPTSTIQMATSSTNEAQTAKADTGTVTTAASIAAIDAQRDREKRLAEAKTEEDRAKVKEESKVHRVVLVFSGEEAELVEEVLGKYPAEKLVKLCQHWKDNGLDETEQEG